MKILQINIRVNKGSVSRITEQIGMKVLEQGWESYIAFGRPSNPSRSQLIQIGSYGDVKLHYVLSQVTGRHGLFSAKATRNLVERIKEIKPDIIHLQNIHGYYINYKVLFEYLNTVDIPIVWTLHDCWSFTGHCSHFVEVGCVLWKTECHNCPLKKAYPRSLFFDFSKKDYALKKRLFASNKNLHLVPVSHWLEGVVRQSFLKGKDIRVIHNGIDLKVFHPYQHQPDTKTKILSVSDVCNEGDALGDHTALYNHLQGGGKFLIVGVATVWSDSKGLKDYISLSRMLGEDFQIALIGVSEIIQKQLPPNIIGLPKTERVEQLAFIYNIADVTVSLSYAESLGMTPIESMACGTPVIVYDNTAQPELVDNQCGIIVPTGDLECLKDALLEIKRKGKKFYSESCVNRAVKLFNKEERYNDYIALYRELCN